MSSNGYRRNDRVKYSEQGVREHLRGLVGTITGFTRAGWAVVDFDCGFANVSVQPVNLDHYKESKVHAET